MNNNMTTRLAACAAIVIGAALPLRAAEVTESDADKLVGRLSEEFPDIEIELNNGGQPIYYYILSVE